MGAGAGGNFGNTRGSKSIKYPGNDPSISPGKDLNGAEKPIQRVVKVTGITPKPEKNGIRI